MSVPPWWRGAVIYEIYPWIKASMVCDSTPSIFVSTIARCATTHRRPPTGGPLAASARRIRTRISTTATTPTLWVAAGLLWLLDASLNVSMEPFRAYVGDQLPPPQRPTGYAMQSFFIGVSSVIASMLPWMLTKLGVATQRCRARFRTP